MKILNRVILCLIFLSVVSCEKTTFSTTRNDLSPPDYDEENKIYITDRTGKSWDITHAVHIFHFDPNNFEHGLGPFAIKPIIDPIMLSPGNSGYPDPKARLQVIGTTIQEESRAYALEDLFGHEIANDVFSNTPVAIAY
jgi:hypothetical protein